MAAKTISARWKELSDQALAVAEEQGDTDLGRAMLTIAALYAKIAAHCEFAEAWDSRDWRAVWQIAPYGIW